MRTIVKDRKSDTQTQMLGWEVLRSLVLVLSEKRAASYWTSKVMAMQMSVWMSGELYFNLVSLRCSVVHR